MFYEKRAEKRTYLVLSCVIYTIIKNYVCIDYLDFQWKKSEIPVSSGGGSKDIDNCFDRILGIGIPYLLMILMSCHGFLRNTNSVVILKCTKRMLEYYFSKGFTILECTYNNLAKSPNDVIQRTNA